MPTLPSNLRRQLERTVKAARMEAEAALREAFARLGLGDETPPTYLGEAERSLRRRLRAHNRRLGGTAIDIGKLVEQAAYLRWHRLLFVRFLDARGLLRHPEGDVLTLADCSELAASEGASDGWALAARYASVLLPQVFAQDDPTLAVVLAPERESGMRRHIGDLPAEVFAASDSLGWTYQYWRAAEKSAVNSSGVKIGADELPAVTQLFTEPYMVRFLLDNTLGAWWAAKMMAADPALKQLPDERSLRAALALEGADWAWLRFIKEDEGWRPAAGGFPGWPQDARSITVIDPCCGSGHFLTEALPILVALRCAGEGLSVDATVVAVLRDNLHGLEIDGRCVQIASFAVALTAWAVGGFQPLPNPKIAWVGAPPPLPRSDFEALGNGDVELRSSLGALYDLFQQAPLLGALIEVSGDDLVARAKLFGVEAAMVRLAERTASSEPERVEGAIAARGMADAAALLAKRFTLVATNVPFLGRGEQSPDLIEFVERRYPVARGDLSTTMIERITKLSTVGGAVATVSKQEWCFLISYRQFRFQLLSTCSIDFIATLGEEAWESFGDRGPLATLTCYTNISPSDSARHFTVDVTAIPKRDDKSAAMIGGRIVVIQQTQQSLNPDNRILTEVSGSVALLDQVAAAYQGISTGDVDRFRLLFWEPHLSGARWRYFASSVSSNCYYSGMEHVLFWGSGGGHLAAIRGADAWKKSGVAVSQMRNLPVAIYTGALFDGNVSAIIPSNDKDLLPIYAYCSDQDYKKEVKRIDKKKNVTNATLVKVPFDRDYWVTVAAERFPNGLPEPYSDDPTQWLFHGHPVQADAGTQLHVALARIAGYRWPAEDDMKMRLSGEARKWITRAAELPAGDNDGLLPIDACSGERPLAERLRAFLAVAYGADWSANLEQQLVEQSDKKLGGVKRASRATLEDWLPTRAFAQHAKLFHDRPFLWHIWDGRADGFSAFVHYNRLDRRTLEKLAYTLINDWITRADDGGKAETARALQARLARILEGEAPHDIFVRWKRLKLQPVGWDPDLDDGVRVNIRPFVTADVLRAPINVHWRKDRGTAVASSPWFSLHKGYRINDYHTTLAEKQAARGPA